jgi:hypothetical protein
LLLFGMQRGIRLQTAEEIRAGAHDGDKPGMAGSVCHEFRKTALSPVGCFCDPIESFPMDQARLIRVAA